MLTLDGKALIAEKNTVVQVMLSGTTDGILNDMRYKISSDKPIVYEIMDKIRTGIIGLTVDEVIDDVIGDGIITAFNLENDEEYIATIIEEVIYKAAINYIKLQNNQQVERIYEEE